MPRHELRFWLAQWSYTCDEGTERQGDGLGATREQAYESAIDEMMQFVELDFAGQVPGIDEEGNVDREAVIRHILSMGGDHRAAVLETYTTPGLVLTAAGVPYRVDLIERGVSVSLKELQRLLDAAQQGETRLRIESPDAPLTETEMAG